MPGRARGAYDWPIKPFGRQHPVRGYLNDPRSGRKLSFHFGIDICAPDGTPVHAVAPGQVVRESGRAVAVVGATRTFGYWHIVPAVANGEFVAKGQLLGHVASTWGHVHFAEWRAGRYRNPLRRGGIHPYADRTKPTIVSIGFFRPGRALSPERVSGKVEVIVEAYDTPPRPAPAPWTGLPVTPALIRWRITRGRRIVVPWHTAIDSRLVIEPPERIKEVYAPGTRQNHPNRAGCYRFYLRRAWRTSQIADGEYRFEVAASDTRGNRTAKALEFTVANNL